VTRSYHYLGNYAVERSVGTVESPRQDRVVNVVDTVAPQLAHNIAKGDIACGSHPALLGMEE